MTKQDKMDEFRDPIGDNMLAQLSGLALDQKIAEAKVEKVTEELRVAKEELALIAEIKIPELMDEAEMTDFTTRDGINICIKENFRASIPEANKPKAFAWLAEHGHDNLIKREFKIEFGKNEEKWAKKFQAYLAKRKEPFKLEVKREVHANTLSAFVKEQVGEGIDVPLDLFGAFRQRISKITLKD